MTIQLFITILLVISCLSVDIPNSLKKCNRNDGNFNSCLTEAVNDALSKSAREVKEINLLSLSPLRIPALVINPGHATVGFVQNYKDVRISGITNFICSKVEMNFDTNTLFLNGTTALARLDYMYEFNGKILVLPIRGKGPGRTDLVNLNIVINFNLREYRKKRKNYYKIVKTFLSMKPERIFFKLENLFDGDKALGNTINAVLNDNWKDVFGDVEDSYEDALAAIFETVFNNVLQKVSVNELFG